MSRSFIAATLLMIVLTIVGAAGISYASQAPAPRAGEPVPVGLAPAAAAVPSSPVPIDQAGWAARKQRVRLPNGIELAYVELGNPNGSPVLLLHGVTDNSRVWTILAPYLAGHRLLIPDQRGHGASSAPACCYAMADLAEDARLFLDALRIERTAVVGHSMGSMVGQVLAAAHPERVERLVLVGSTAVVPLRRTDPLWSQVNALREPFAANRDFLREWSPRASPTPVDEALLGFYEPEIEQVPLHVFRGVLGAVLDLPVGRRASEVRAPVLILSGGADPLFGPEHHASLVEAYPRAEAHVLPGLGHNFIVERPHQVGPLLAAFLRRPTPEQTAARLNPRRCTAASAGGWRAPRVVGREES